MRYEWGERLYIQNAPAIYDEDGRFDSAGAAALLGQYVGAILGTEVKDCFVFQKGPDD